MVELSYQVVWTIQEYDLIFYRFAIFLTGLLSSVAHNQQMSMLTVVLTRKKVESKVYYISIYRITFSYTISFAFKLKLCVKVGCTVCVGLFDKNIF